jgi:hypothetical protein
LIRKGIKKISYDRKIGQLEKEKKKVSNLFPKKLKEHNVKTRNFNFNFPNKKSQNIEK